MPAEQRARARIAQVLALASAFACAVSLCLPASAGAGHARRHRAARAPSGPPLAGAGASGGELGEGEQAAGVQSASGDQLVENGLASPLCRGTLASGLSRVAQANCRTSGFVGAAAPTNDYALDVHIDTGAFGLSKGALLSVVQDIFIAPVWGAVEWLVHALLVALEWCYTLELLAGAGTSTVARALAQGRASFTDPWLAPALALAALLVLHHGLVRRRVADTLAGALTMFAMMAGGLWVIADPEGTVGAIGRFADQASLGALDATTAGTPSSTPAALGEGMRALYATAIETPWCYLEFGNVRWCEDPSRLDPQLRAAALAIVAAGEAPARTREMVRSAHSNGALFLAFPANGPERNSINRQGSLLRTICRSEEATKCSGPDAAEAEFRTDGGTFPRMLGLLAIVAGVLGLLLLFGAIAMRLLAAALLSVLILLLAPIAVLAPAFGDGGRAVFAGWATRLLGAVAARLLFSFVLGALLTTQQVVASLAVLGWWTQWLLFSATWWMAFLNRHQAAAIVRHGGRGRPDPAGAPAGRSALGALAQVRPVRRVEQALRAYSTVRHPREWVQAQVNAKVARDVREAPSKESPGIRRYKPGKPASTVAYAERGPSPPAPGGPGGPPPHPPDARGGPPPHPPDVRGGPPGHFGPPGLSGPMGRPGPAGASGSSGGAADEHSARSPRS
jgi:hypothetical protein